MKPLGSPREHYWLARRMAQAAGVDLAAAQAKGALPQQDWAALVEDCRGCNWAGGCRSWLAHSEAERDRAGSFGIPHTCPNRARFEALLAGQRHEVTE
ncbi:MAG: DUF6455 family protein [Paracoccaceae bacterium]